MKIYKVLMFVFMIILILCAILVVIGENSSENALKGTGMDCFNSCKNICLSQNSKVLSFTATKSTCGCTCSNYDQSMFPVKFD